MSSGTWIFIGIMATLAGIIIRVYVPQAIRAKIRRIAPNLIGKHGQLQEWLEDVDNPKNHHRHVSHLWGLHPGNEITPDTPDLFAAEVDKGNIPLVTGDRKTQRSRALGRAPDRGHEDPAAQCLHRFVPSGKGLDLGGGCNRLR